MNWIHTHNGRLGAMRLPRVLSPFKYEHNFCGVRARDFLGAVGSRLGNHLVTIGKPPQTITLTGLQLELSDTSGTGTITGPVAG